jgi:hypothetical protein
MNTEQLNAAYEKLTREAGFKDRNGQIRVQHSNGQIRVQHSNGSFVVIADELESFAALVLEAAAVEFNQPHMELFMDQIQDAIRAMKPGVKP